MNPEPPFRPLTPAFHRIRTSFLRPRRGVAILTDFRAPFAPGILRLWRDAAFVRVVPLLLLFLLAGCVAPVQAIGPIVTAAPAPGKTAPAALQPAPGGIGSGPVAPIPGSTAAGAAAPAVTGTPTGTPEPSATPTLTDTPEAAALTAPPLPSNMAIMLAASVNMRAGPGTDYPVLVSVPGGTEFTVLGQDETGEWLYIGLDDGEAGWVDRSLTSYAGEAPVVLAAAPPPTPTPPAPAAVTAPSVVLLAPGANVTYPSGGVVTVQWSATDNSGIPLAQVQLLVDNAVVQATAGNGGTSLQASQQWQATTVGSHVISVIAIDAYGIAGPPASVTIYVTSSSTTSSLTSYITQPGSNIVVVSGQSVTIDATGNGPNGINRL